MSLKGFHVFFIALSVLCTSGFGLWTFVSESEANTGGVRAFGIASAVSSVLLLAYGIWFYRNKVRDLRLDEAPRQS